MVFHIRTTVWVGIRAIFRTGPSEVIKSVYFVTHSLQFGKVEIFICPCCRFKRSQIRTCNSICPCIVISRTHEIGRRIEAITNVIIFKILNTLIDIVVIIGTAVVGFLWHNHVEEVIIQKVFVGGTRSWQTERVEILVEQCIILAQDDAFYREHVQIKINRNVRLA